MEDHELLTAIYDTMQEMKQDVFELKQDVSGLKQDVSGLKQDVSGLKQDVSALNSRQDSLEKNVRDIRLILENEIKHNISIIAEGHLTLARKFSEVTKVEQEKEMMGVRIGFLESEMRLAKSDIAQLKKAIEKAPA